MAPLAPIDGLLRRFAPRNDVAKAGFDFKQYGLSDSLAAHAWGEESARLAFSSQ